MNEIDIRLDCDRYTKYSNLINKGDEIICPECSKHKVNISETFRISINREKILRKEVELFFEKLELNNLNDCIEKHFDEITFQIDIHCESIIEKINVYRIDLIEKVKKKRNEIFSQLDIIKKSEMNSLNKNTFIDELNNTENLFDKLEIEENIKQKLTEKVRMEDEIIDQTKKYKFVQSEKNDIKDLIGILDGLFFNDLFINYLTMLTTIIITTTVTLQIIFS
ncbi:unnamed protein product [Brachionus calyciflorus]|uniref:Uncharacterized protein n=1 Tax=Brachionus calyciflorus TaxID=104777 RepID=A0A814M187_9BILA|nr:unnamed protein product [Brachionus calyciflorus]